MRSAKWRNPKLWIGIVSSVVVLYLALDSLGRTSPGPLSLAHAELDGPGNCSKCHGGWFEEMTDACLKCHAPIDKQIESGTGLHGTLDSARASQCAVCHSDHHGPSFQMVNAQSFAAVDTTREAFDHNIVGFAMTGKHLELECAECHKNADNVLLLEGETRFLGLDRNCAVCHEDSHEGAMVLECAQCHGQKSWESLHSDGHARFLPLKGAHAEVSCRKCHEKEGAHALEVLGRRDHAARQCQDCHESPHTPSFVQESASLAAIAPSASCVVCHDYDHTEWRDKRVTTTPPQHSASGFDLVAPHAEVKCEECHKTDAPTFAARYPGRKQDDCASCHEDVHRGQFKNSAGAQNGCIDCHERVHFKPHAFTVEKHAQTELPLEGKHVETDCNECHKDPPMNKPRAFEGTSSRCEACHEDAHAGFFGIHDDVLEKHKHGSCAVCHIPSSFRDGVPGASFDHGKWTGFAVRGAHAQTACETCHPRQKEPDRTGRTLGRSHDKFGRYEGCATCHKDPHDGGFDKKTLPKAVEGRKGCARCHTETSFRDFPDGFDHGQWTGFLLGGAHLRAGCAACHTPLRRPAKSGRTWGRAKGAKCADCHDDPHAEQFEVHDNDCEKCHRSAASFADLTFRHNFDSRFRLDETHAQVACAKCHKKEKIKGKLVARYRPLGMKCADCHGAHENPLRRRKRSRR